LGGLDLILDVWKFLVPDGWMSGDLWQVQNIAVHDCNAWAIFFAERDERAHGG
jgi:hypothetical protein